MDNGKVHYTQLPDNSIIYIIDKSEIETINRLETASENFHRQQIKIDIIALSFSTFNFGYERVINGGKSWEAFIGFDPSGSRRSFEIGSEYKFYFKRTSLKKILDSDLFSGTYTFMHLSAAIQENETNLRNPITGSINEGVKTDKAVFSGLGFGWQLQSKNISMDISSSILYFAGTTSIQVLESTTRTEPITSYNSGSGMLNGENNIALNIKFKVGYQF